MAIDVDGNLWTWGYNEYGQLGDGTTSYKSVPAKISWTSKFIAASCGENCSFAIDENGTLIGWGKNDYGQLGNGTHNDQLIPIQIEGDIKFRSISAGATHVIAIDEAGNSWVWGCNGYNQLGNKVIPDKYVSVKNANGIKFNSISASANYCIGIDESYRLWAWGQNLDGQLGDGTKVSICEPKQIGQDKKFHTISCGASHSLAIDESGNLFAWGYNYNGQLGNGTTIDKSTSVSIKSDTKFKTVSAGGAHSLAIDFSGNLWAWGNNYNGQVGDGTKLDKLSPVPIISGTKFKVVSAGTSSSFAIDESDNLWAWGYNYHGALGDGTMTDKSSPIQISGTKFKSISAGSSHAIAIDLAGNIWIWGDNFYGQLGVGYSYANELSSPHQILNDTKFVSVCAANCSSFAIDESGFLWVWGANKSGQLGIASKEDRFGPFQKKMGTKFKSVSAGFSHVVAIDQSGDLWVSGSNKDGQLGDGTAWCEIPSRLNSNLSTVVNVTGVVISSSTLLINKGLTCQLNATVSPENASNKTVTWFSSDHAVATVNSSGLITGVTSGSAVITVKTTDGSKTATCVVTVVVPVSGVEVSSVASSINIGLTAQLNAIISPSDATNKQVIWSSSDETIAMVNPNGLVTGVKSGNVVITATTVDGAKTDSCLVTVISPVSGITLSSETSTIRKYSTFQLTATIIPFDATNDTIIWSSSDITIATVDSIGQVTGIKSGVVTIYATTVDGAKTDSCLVTVISPVSGITLSSETATIRRDSTFQLTATIIPSDATNDTIIWLSSDETIAAVDSTGLVTGIKSGTAIITATTVDGGKIASCEVTVLAGLSVFQSEVGTQLKVYPNPLKDGLLNICLSELIGDADLSIFNANGQLVYSGLIRTNETVQINYKTFRSGLYLIKVSGNTINEVRKVLVE